MNKNVTFYLSSAIALMLLATPIKGSAQITPTVAPFEGTMTYTITVPQMGDEKMPMTTSVKGKKVVVATDMGAMGGMHMYMDQDKKTMIMVMDNMKMGYTMDLPADADGVKADTSQLTATGKTDNINGFSSQEFVGNTKDGTIDIWASADFPASIRLAMVEWMKNNPQNGGGKMFRLLSERGLAPVRISTMKGSEVGAVIELVKFEQKSLPDAMFVAPTDIKLSAMPTGMGH